METQVLKQWGATVLRIGVGGLFVYAGALKALEPTAFLKSIENYQILPHTVAVASSFFLPFLEIFCGTGLILKRLQSGALALLGAMMLVFIVALSAAWARGLDIDCGCFGSGESKGQYGLALARDFLLLAAIGFLAFRGDPE